MTDRELMQQALDDICGAKLCEVNSMSSRQEMMRLLDKAVEALRARLAQPEPEPVAWMRDDEMKAIVDDEKSAWIEAGQPELIADYTVPLYTAPPRKEWQPKGRLWLWKNFVDGRPEYWAFDNPYPRNIDNADPQTLGEPCGYAIFKPSRDGSDGRTEEYALEQIAKAVPYPRKEWQGLTDEEYEAMAEKYVTNCYFNTLKYSRAIEAKLREKNS